MRLLVVIVPAKTKCLAAQRIGYKMGPVWPSTNLNLPPAHWALSAG